MPAQSAYPSDHTAKVWPYASGLLNPVIVQTGLAHDRWTELVGGPLHPNDALATGVWIAP
jgi:hypothetical protein